MDILPKAIRDEVKKRGLSAVLDEVADREEIARYELTYWREVRHELERLIPNSIIDELSQIAEEAFNNDTTN